MVLVDRMQVVMVAVRMRRMALLSMLKMDVMVMMVLRMMTR